MIAEAPHTHTFPTRPGDRFRMIIRADDGRVVRHRGRLDEQQAAPVPCSGVLLRMAVELSCLGSGAWYRETYCYGVDRTSITVGDTIIQRGLVLLDD